MADRLIPVFTSTGLFGTTVGNSAWHESIRRQQKLFSEKPETAHIELVPGIFAENFTTEGIDLLDIRIGIMLRAGGVRLRLSKIGKECHTKCAIFRKIGDCIMPAEGVFCEVLEGGVIRAGDSIERIG